MDEKDDWASSRWSVWEKQTLEELDQDCAASTEDTSTDGVTRNLWERFESTAHGIAQLYKASNWSAFERVATATTDLYKESVEAHRRGIELGQQQGRKKLTREILAFIRRHHKKQIHREELVGFLAGKQPPIRQNPRGSPRHRLSNGVATVNHGAERLALQNSPLHQPSHHYAISDCDLTMFKEALVLPYQRDAQRRSAAAPDLGAFFLEEWGRHRKRSASAALLDDNNDVTMDSPTQSGHKRNRFC